MCVKHRDEKISNCDINFRTMTNNSEKAQLALTILIVIVNIINAGLAGFAFSDAKKEYDFIDNFYSYLPFARSALFGKHE